MEYVILAAGQGSRFVKEGEPAPKPMVDILGRPMIGRLIDILSQCGASRIHVVTNIGMESLNNYLRDLSECSPVDLNIKPIRSDNSFYSLQEGCADARGKFIAMTVDAIFPTREFRDYVEAVSNMPDNTLLMGLTHFIDDESPLYADLDDATSEIRDYRYGGEPFPGTPIVSAGLYGLTRSALDVACTDCYPESLSDFQRILAVGDHFKVKPFIFSKAFDVDCGHDRLEAEKFVAEVNGECRCDSRLIHQTF